MADYAGTMEVVDSHVHVWGNDPRFPWAKGFGQPPAADATPEQLLKLMAAHGVDRTVVVHVIYYGWDCRYAAESLRVDRNRLMGVCRVDPRSEQAAQEVDHWVVDEGFHGVRLSPNADPTGDWIQDSQRVDAIVDRCAAHGVPLCFLCGVERLDDVGRVIARHDGKLDFCIDQMADCPIDQPVALTKLLNLASFPRVFVKISHLWSLSRREYPYRDTWDQVKRIMEAFSADRVMWGSDWPVVEKYCSYGQAVELYRERLDSLSVDERRSILGATARRLWPFPAKG
jgi:predicted TIM-barrel fold metal-dependent hydrolase